MSHSVQINYEQLGIQCQSICETAENALKQIEGEIEAIERESSTLLNEQSESLKNAILRERDDIVASIEKVRTTAEREGKGIKYGSSYREPAFMVDARQLRDASNNFVTSRLIEYQSLITQLLGEAIKTDERKETERRTGIVSIDDATQKVLDSISDDVLRQFTHIAYIKDNTLVGDALRKAGQQLMDESVNMTYEQRKEAEKEKIRRELEMMRIDRKQVDAIMEMEGATARDQLQNIRAAATEEIVGEKVRQKSIKIIMNAIQDRGFIVDKKNMRINRDTNEVTLVALKASGEKAEFRVFLDGKFIYDFRGYEGQACQKDIEPFMNDLEEVYGMHVTDTKEIWKNPDKISTMKYQTYKTNKNTD
ncbi:MAG: hypothetical protein LUD72_08740 [Bacteroidales bacterium]|nr:hypothetical protein [Bacteroidales bacterium]